MDNYGSAAYDSAAVERPGCVTAYAILMWLAAAVYLIAAFVGGMSIASEVVIVLCLVPIFIIAMLTLLGPQIGEVFSNIVDELSTPSP